MQAYIVITMLGGTVRNGSAILNKNITEQFDLVIKIRLDLIHRNIERYVNEK